MDELNQIESQSKGSGSKPANLILITLGAIVLVGGVLLYLRFGPNSGPDLVSDELNKPVDNDELPPNDAEAEFPPDITGFVDIVCNGKDLKVGPELNDYSVRVIVPEDEVATGSELTSLINCYLDEYQGTDFVTGAIGDDAHSALNRSLEILGTTDELTRHEQLLIDTRTFTGQRGTESNNISLPKIGNLSQ